MRKVNVRSHKKGMRTIGYDMIEKHITPYGRAVSLYIKKIGSKKTYVVSPMNREFKSLVNAREYYLRRKRELY